MPSKKGTVLIMGTADMKRYAEKLLTFANDRKLYGAIVDKKMSDGSKERQLHFWPIRYANKVILHTPAEDDEDAFLDED